MATGPNASPKALSCPQCGGEATPESVRCAYCGVALATVACPACFGSLFVGMKHCPWCGAGAARREEPPAALGRCPHCAEDLQPIQVGRTGLGECRRCGGVWVNKAGFETLCMEREEQEAILGEGLPQPTAPAANAGAPKRFYIPCPACRKLMHRLNFAHCSGIVIDRCKEHGVWFDHQELQGIVRFIQAGGMKKSRQREKEQLREEADRLRRDRLMDTATRPARHAIDIEQAAQLPGIDLEFLPDVLDVIRRLFR